MTFDPKPAFLTFDKTTKVGNSAERLSQSIFHGTFLALFETAQRENNTSHTFHLPENYSAVPSVPNISIGLSSKLPLGKEMVLLK